MKVIEKLIIIILIVSTFLPPFWSNILIKTNVNPAIQWIIYRINAAFVGLLIIIAISTCLLLLSKNRKTLVSSFGFNILDFSVLTLFFGIGSFTAIIGFLRGNLLYYVIGDTYIYFSFGILYFLAARFVRGDGILKIIDFSVYFIFITIILETIYRLTGYFLTKSLLNGGVFYYLLPFIYFFSKYIYIPSKKTLTALTISILCIILTFHRTLAIVSLLIVFLLPLLILRLKLTHLKIVGLFIFLVTIAWILHSTNILPIFGRYDLSWYYQHYFGDARIQEPEVRTAEVISSINTMRGNVLNYFWGMGQGAIAIMTKRETYEEIYIHEEGGGTFETGKVHSIHFTPASIFFRTGALGLAAFALFLFLALLFLYKNFSLAKSSQNKFYAEVVLLFFIASVPYSFSRYEIVNDLVLATFIGLVRNPNFGKI